MSQPPKPRHTSKASRLTHEQHPDQALSAAHDEQILGYLSVLVTFLEEPVSDLALWFTDAKGVLQRDKAHKQPENAYSAPGDPEVTPTGWTDARGCFLLSHKVRAGTYHCKVQGQPATLVTTVDHASYPFVIVLPIGRSYYDIYGEKFESKLPE